MLRHQPLIVRNLERDGIVISYGEEKSRTLKLGEEARFECRLGQVTIGCEQNLMA